MASFSIKRKEVKDDGFLGEEENKISSYLEKLGLEKVVKWYFGRIYLVTISVLHYVIFFYKDLLLCRKDFLNLLCLYNFYKKVLDFIKTEWRYISANAKIPLFVCSSLVSFQTFTANSTAVC